MKKLTKEECSGLSDFLKAATQEAMQANKKALKENPSIGIKMWMGAVNPENPGKYYGLFISIRATEMIPGLGIAAVMIEEVWESDNETDIIMKGKEKEEGILAEGYVEGQPVSEGTDAKFSLN